MNGNLIKKKNLAVIFGGRSSEYEVSLRSVTSVLENLDADKYDITTIGITKEGDWYLYTGPYEKITDGTWKDGTQIKPAFFTPSRKDKGLIALMNDGTYVVLKTDVIMPILHGQDGEDGKIQGLLEMGGIPFVGCDTASSAVCMDKDYAHKILEASGVEMAKWFLLRRSQRDDVSAIHEKIQKELGFPVFVKPANSGSSVGVSKVDDETQLADALDKGFLEDSKLVIEEAIVGQEVECAVFGNGNKLIASPLGEIIPEVFYDYEAKYENDSAKLVIPAGVSAKSSDEVREISKKAYIALGCAGLARVDSFVKSDGTVIINELNTLPGFTSISMYPKLMEEAGLSYGKMLDGLIELAFEREEVRKLEK